MAALSVVTVRKNDKSKGELKSEIIPEVGVKEMLNIPDGVTGAEADPLREGAVLLLLLSKDLLDLEGLVGGLK